MTKNAITIATDGSCLGNPGPTGWAWVRDDNVSRSGGQPKGTNQVGELKAIISALAHHPFDDIVIESDSQYALDIATKWGKGWKKAGWKKWDGKPIRNLALVKSLMNLLETRQGSVTFRKVKGHDVQGRYPLNDKADQLAVAASRRARESGAFQE